ncbi:hypothetical protein THRCLA_00189 [Thraustotheca clavata]|uniref:Uncharacterized protein n=1 Tax=Thraustotheca clavata TaxID=74557 RepID=A0A1W0ACD9_9STRA|nr:hypothetical protein THRCLA_00189 [Thraustotheca clavata]
MAQMCVNAVSLRFLTSEFKAHYQRNNKQGGHKNLRCFPNCCNGIHASSGFCGSAVLVQISPTMPCNQLAVYAAFCPLNTAGQPQSLTYLRDIKTTEQLNALADKERDVHSPWYAGDCVNNDNGVYSINTFKRGWHYGWTSNRHMADTKHVLCVYVFERNKPSLDCCFWSCVGELMSPAFQLYCRRRAKGEKMFWHNEVLFYLKKRYQRNDMEKPMPYNILRDNDMGKIQCLTKCLDRA